MLYDLFHAASNSFRVDFYSYYIVAFVLAFSPYQFRLQSASLLII